MANNNSYKRPTLKYTPRRYMGNSLVLSNNYLPGAGRPYSSFKYTLRHPRLRPLALRSPSVETLPDPAGQDQMDQDSQLGTFDLPQAKLNGLLCELQRLNRQGRMVTYDRSKGPLGGWVHWLR